MSEVQGGGEPPGATGGAEPESRGEGAEDEREERCDNKEGTKE